MADTPTPPHEPSVSDSLGLTRYTFTPAKRAVVAVAVLLTLGGFGLRLAEPSRPARDELAEASEPAAQPIPAQPGATRVRDLGSALDDSGGPAPAGFTSEASRVPFTGEATTAEPLPQATGATPAPPLTPESTPEPTQWSGPMLRGGFGLGIGFLIGFAIRAFLRLAGVLLGFYLLSLTLMAYSGWIEIHWDVIEAAVVPALNGLGQELTSFKTFLAGSLPTAGLASMGLATGLKQK